MPFQSVSNYMKKLLFILVIYMLCSGTSAAQAKDLTIAVSIVPEIKLVQEVVGDKAEILCVIPEGGSPASYAPSPKALMEIQKAGLCMMQPQRSILI